MSHKDFQQSASDIGDDYDEEDDGAIKKERKGIMKCLCNNLFMITIIIGVLVGFAIGFGIRTLPVISEEIKVWISMPGDIYIRLLKLTILPLIASNVIIVIAKLDPKENGKVSVISFIYIIVANICGSSVGVAASIAIGPGNIELNSGVGDGGSVVPKPPPEDVKPATTSDVFADLLLNIFPENIIGISLFQVVTSYKTIKNATGPSIYERQVINEDGTNMIGVIFVAVVFGLSASAAKENGVPFLEFFTSLAEVVLKLIRAFLKATPVGVAFMIAGAVIKVDDIVGTFAKLAIFIGTVVVGIAVMFILTLIIYGAALQRNPFIPIPHLLKGWFIAFATTSAIVSVPELYAGCDAMKISKGTSRFVTPLAATLKADGSAVFISAASVFICQLEKKGDNAGTIVVIWLLTCALAIAIPHIPSSSVVIIITILTSVGVNVEQVSLLYATEWLLDRIRSGFSTLSTFYCVCFTEYIANRKKVNGSEVDEFDDAISQLTQSAKDYRSSIKSGRSKK